jgi:hypothetical protein
VGTGGGCTGIEADYDAERVSIDEARPSLSITGRLGKAAHHEPPFS